VSRLQRLEAQVAGVASKPYGGATQVAEREA